MRCITKQATSRSAFMASTARHPGVRDRFEHYNESSTEQVRPASQRKSRTLPASGWCDDRSRSASLVSKREAIVPWESEPLIVAMKSGNADGAKGWQFS